LDFSTGLAMIASMQADDSWDAGDLGCGELVILLRERLLALPPGAIFLLTATDPGAVHDIPAWGRLTRHGLVEAAPPHYLIRRKD
jgi:tRNA 2-thiouridine synthesizing protein A